ncbi:MAG TPA: GyrI-like domain-containing protein, partial [Clostridiaceae bacterium]|nr:GyrI-like domain-containing protein [Clostridiaceae bacterium]
KAIGFHKGSYRELSSLYDRMTSWLKERGLTPAGIVYEYYYNSPGEIPESELLTKVEFLLN